MISPVTASVSSLRFASSGVRWLDISVKPTRSDWASVCQWTWWNGETDMDLYGNMKVRQLTMEWTMKWNMEGNYIYIWFKWNGNDFFQQLSYAEFKKHFCKNTSPTRVLSSITVWQGAMVAMWYLWDGSGESSAEASAFTSYCVKNPGDVNSMTYWCLEGNEGMIHN